MKLRYIFKFLFYTDGGNKRVSLIFPIIGVLLGSYVIFITYSIMNGLETTIESKLSSFNYKYMIDENKLTHDYIDKNNCENYGFENVGLLKNNLYEEIVKVKYYENIDKYYSKIKPYLLFDSKCDITNGIIIGDELALKLNVQIGDSLDFSIPSDINLATNYLPSTKLEIVNIFNYDIFEYDNIYAVLSMRKYKELSRITNALTYYDDKIILSDIKDNNLLISAVKLEKKIYTGLSFLLIFISCVMIFNIMIMILIEKHKQFYFVNTIGLSGEAGFKIVFIQNIIMSLFFTSLGYILADLTIYLNYKYNLFGMIFDFLPFKILPMNIDLYSALLIFILTNLFIVISSTLPFLIRKKIQ